MITQMHREYHFRETKVVRDAVIGLADGLTVPFALAAGLSAAVRTTGIIVTAGLAEIVAGSISMALGGYLASKTEVEHYLREKGREARETKEIPDMEAQEVVDIFSKYGMSREQVNPILDYFRKNRAQWVNFMMRFELGLDEPDPARARISAFTIGSAYAVGGLVPLVPYFFLASVPEALKLSVVITLVALFIFGFIKGQLTAVGPLKNAWRTTLIGALAAGAAALIARLVSSV